jgi:hypothetical protein
MFNEYFSFSFFLSIWGRGWGSLTRPAACGVAVSGQLSMGLCPHPPLPAFTKKKGGLFATLFYTVLVSVFSNQVVDVPAFVHLFSQVFLKVIIQSERHHLLGDAPSSIVSLFNQFFFHSNSSIS